MGEKVFWAYIVTNCRRGVLYVGVTSNIVQRAGQHKNGVYSGFSRKWGLKRLVWFQDFADSESAIMFEKRLKRWQRPWKFELIEKVNPEWNDLGEGFFLP